MRDVAALAGVSVKTVSRVVNDEPGVSADVRERVGAAVHRLDYRQNLAASNLRRIDARTGLVGALLQDISNSFSGAVLRALEDAAREHRSAVLAASLDEGTEREQELVHDLVLRRVDGLVIMPATHRQDYLASELRTGTPVVFVDCAPRGIDADSVTVDNDDAARRATEHLLARGHRRVGALFDLATISTAERRRAGFTRACTDRGIRPDPALVRSGVRSAEQAYAAVRQMLGSGNPPTALFTGRNVITAGAVRALAEAGVRDHVALVGFDDFPLADLLDPPLTVVSQDVRRIGRTVADLLFARIEGDAGPPRHVVIEPTLVIRGSGEIPPPA
jgi:LacI family transcriptional regulator